jgi:hypothetical protein
MAGRPPFRNDLNNSPISRALIGAFQNFAVAWDELKRQRLAMIQMKDANAGDASDWATMNAMYKFVNPTDGTTDSTNQQAFAAFQELDSLVSNHIAAIDQAIARFRQS